jgi:hypothetical protein
MCSFADPSAVARHFSFAVNAQPKTSAERLFSLCFGCDFAPYDIFCFEDGVFQWVCEATQAEARLVRSDAQFQMHTGTSEVNTSLLTLARWLSLAGSFDSLITWSLRDPTTSKSRQSREMCDGLEIGCMEGETRKYDRTSLALTAHHPLKV